MRSSFSLLFLLLFVTFTLKAQNVGGFDAGEITPQEAKPYDIKSGVISGNVNLFDGSYNYSQPLANISTPSGLSYGVQLSYNSTNQTGNNPSHLSGVPYGDGWSIAIPNIKVSTGVYSKYGDCGVDYANGATKKYDYNEAVKEGQLYWMAPVLNIPGIVSGRMVFKEKDINGPIFVMHEFEKYVEARFKGQYWEVRLWDGTIWEFKHTQVSYRNATDQRVHTDSTGVDNVLQNLTIPKIDAASFYATKIYNPNHPAGNSIQFEYEINGTFNFHKEHLQSNVHQGYSYLDVVWVDNIVQPTVIYDDSGNQTGVTYDTTHVNSWQLGSSSVTNTVHQFTGFEGSRDYFLKGIYSFSTAKVRHEKIEFDYKTYHFSNAVNLPQISDTGVIRYDSLYNISSVYKVNHANSGFDDWTRFRHFRSDEVNSGGSLLNMQKHNPFVGQTVMNGPQRLLNENVSSGAAGLSFDHSYLESPKIGGGDHYNENDYMIPGEIYEIKTKILNQNSNNGFDKFCNFDINLSTGSDHTNFLGNSPNMNYEEYSKERAIPIFSTFGRSIKWNNILHGVQGTALMTTSNLFTMPLMPMTEFEGFTVQVGPGNTDQLFTARKTGDPQESILGIFLDEGSGTEIINVQEVYLNANSNLIDGISPVGTSEQRVGDPIKRNFGTGYPWHMMKPLYEKSLAILEDIDRVNFYNRWWSNNEYGSQDGWDNNPTLANEDVFLQEVELLRYSKNPYLLHTVKHYKYNGEIIGGPNGLSGDGVRLVSEFELDYKLKTSSFERDFSKEFTSSYQKVGGRRNIINLKSIIQNPIKDIENLDPIYTHFDYDEMENPFESTNVQITKLDGTIKDIVLNQRHFGVSHLNVLSKITNKLGGETDIKYYDFYDANTTFEFTTQDKKSPASCFAGTNTTAGDENFSPINSAFSLKPAVKQVIVQENGYNNAWDYEYYDKSKKGFNHYWQVWNSHLDGVIGIGQTGFSTTKVFEPYLDPTDSTKRAYSVHKHYTDSILEWHLFGKLKDTKQYDENDNLLAESSTVYQSLLAYRNGKFSNLGAQECDYCGNFLSGATFSPGSFLIDGDLDIFGGINPIIYAESESLDAIQGLSNKYLNSYFITKSKEINTYYEYVDGAGASSLTQIIDNIDHFITEDMSIEAMVDYTKAIDSNLIDSTDIISINDFSRILQTSYLSYFQDSLTLKWTKSERNQKGETHSITVAFLDRSMANIVDRDLASTVYLRLSNETKQDLYVAFLEDNTKNEDNLDNLTDDGLGDTLKIDLVTDYQYWDAQYDGKTTSNGYEILLQANIDDNVGYLQLFSEPSWQLFSKTTYSPQNPDTYNREEYYYFFDLHNTWIGNEAYDIPETHIQYKVCSRFGIRNLVYEVDNIQKKINEKPIIKYNYLHYWDEWVTRAPYDQTQLKDEIEFSSEDISSIPPILLQAGYFEPISVEDSLIAYEDSVIANTPGLIYPSNSGCISVPKFVNLGFLPIDPPVGYYYYENDTSGKWYCPDSVRYLFGMPSDPYLALGLGDYLDLAYVPILDFTKSNPTYDDLYDDGADDSLELVIETKMYNDGLIDELSNGNIPVKSTLNTDPIGDYLPYWILNMDKIHLKEVFVNLDTLDLYPLFDLNATDPEIMSSSTVLPSFLPENYHQITRWETGSTNRLGSPIPVPVIKPIKPYETKKMFTIHERNNFAQPSLVEDEKGLYSRYNFVDQYERVFYRDQVDNQPYESMLIKNFALPKDIVIGVGLEDSLKSSYDYSDELDIASIIDPNGMEASYTYDDFRRLKSSYLNGNKLDLNVYNYWNGDPTLSYDEKALQNYSEKYIFFNTGADKGNKIRNYIDPTGKDYGTLSQSFNANPLSWHENLLYSGEVVLDKWGRAIKSYKAFETTVTNPADREIPVLNTENTAYPQEFIQTQYEGNQRSRPLKTADFGVVITNAHTISNEYKLVKGLQVALELNLSTYEKDLLFGDEIEKFVFKRTKTKDQDGKVNYEYTDAFDRKIALKQVLDRNNYLVTLFIYDAMGNVAKVINPKKQESDYAYNLEGLMYKKQTPDEGMVKFRYNKAKQVVIQQDANFSSPNWDDNKYRAYSYDAFGNLTKQYTYGVKSDFINVGRCVASCQAIYDHESVSQIMDLPLYYDDILLENNKEIPFRFINTYDDVETYKAEPQFNNVLALSYAHQFTSPILKNSFEVIDSNTIKLEKSFEYNEVDTTDHSIHLNARLFITNSSENLKGKVARSIAYDNDGKPIQYSYFSYNDNGNLKWEMKQFSPNGIHNGEHGMLYRIDYKDYDYQGNLLTKNIDINGDFTLDAQYYYGYDEWNRLSDTYFNMDDSKANGNRIASFHYDNASGKILKTNYYKNLGTMDTIVDSITYDYDLRERLTDIQSNFFDWAMYYDGNDLANVVNSNNYNGNINATKASYKLAGYTATTGLFDESTNYGYTYDNINRLSIADAHKDADGNVGDVKYTYDVIGNLMQLNRFNPGATAVEEFTYQYENGTNRLLAVNSSVISNNRDYTYDANGNLLTDSYKKLNNSEYGRANLPVKLKLENEDNIDYLFDEADDRLYKNVVNGVNSSKAKEYYLKDASGKTLSVYNYNSTSFEWYMFGANRTAKTTPNFGQQPVLEITADDANVWGEHRNAIIENNDFNERSKQLRSTLLEFETKSYGFPDDLLLVRYTDQSEEVIMRKNFDDKRAQFPNLGYEIQFSTYIENDKQSITLEKDLLNFVNIDEGNQRKEVSMSIEELLLYGALDTISIDSLSVPLSFLQNVKPTPAYDPFNDSTYTELTDTVLHNIYFYVYDHLGNTRIVYSPTITPSDSTIEYDLKGVFDYYPYGKILRQYDPYLEEKYLTTQHQRDLETGFDYRGARFYDADVARFLSVDPLASKYPNMSSFLYVGANPLFFVDPDGREIKIAFEEGTYETFKQIVNEGLEGQYRMALVKNDNGEILLKITATENGGCFNEMSDEGKAFYNHLAKVTGTKNVSASVTIVKGHTDTKIGNYSLQKIDIADIDNFNKGGSSVDKSKPVGATKQGKLIHELVEQFEKAERGYGGDNTKQGFTNSHSVAIQAEDEVNGNTRLTDKEHLGKGNSVMTQYYKEKDGSITKVEYTISSFKGGTSRVTQVNVTTKVQYGTRQKR